MERYFATVKMENGGKFHFICVEYCKMNSNLKIHAEVISESLCRNKEMGNEQLSLFFYNNKTTACLVTYNLSY